MSYVNKNFNEWLAQKQTSGKYKTKLYLKGNIESQVTHQMCYVDGVYYVQSEYGTGMYDCISETNNPINVKYKDLRKIILCVYYSDDIDNWTKPMGVFSHDNKQSADTFNGTLWYIVLMVLVSLFNGRVIGWIFITIVYFIWKYQKYS